MKVRTATPADGEAVSRVHVSTVDPWTVRDDAALRPPRPFVELTPFERFSLGGPWMDPGACGQHLARVLASGQWPLVVEDDSGRVVGEAEVIVGPDVHWGRTAHLDVMAVAREGQRKGYGSALVREARRRAEEAGCATLTTNPEPDAVEFYRRNGLHEVLARQREFSVPVPRGGAAASAALPAPPLSDFAELAPLDLLLGRFQTSYATWIKATWPVEGFTDRLRREEGTLLLRRTRYRLGQVARRTASASACLWADPATDLAEAARLLAERARELGYLTLETTVDPARASELAGLPGLSWGEESVLLGAALEAGPAPPLRGDDRNEAV